MLDRRCKSVEEAMEGVKDGASIMISGFGDAGRPNYLLKCLLDTGAKDLHIISNNAGNGDEGLAIVMRNERVSKLTCSFPRGDLSAFITERVGDGRLTVEVNPQGTLAERIRAAGAGIPAFYTPTAYGTMLGEGKETRMFNGVGHVLETALHADFAFVKVHKADRWGNATYMNLARNFAPLMAMAGTVTVAEADEIVELGALEPNAIHTPGICIDRLVTTQEVSQQEWEAAA